jgi:hypothetical protein
MRGRLVDARTGKHHSYRDRDHTLVHHEIVLPLGADKQFLDPKTLWNAAEKAERRKDALVGRELIMMLPADSEISHAERVELGKAFIQEHFVSKGLGVQIDIHGSHSSNPDKLNFHLHALTTTRRIEGDQLSHLKARDLDPAIRLSRGKPLVVEANDWGVLWREFQDAYFTARGKSLRVDPLAPIPQPHLGPKRWQHPLNPQVQLAAEIRLLNAALGHRRITQIVAERQTQTSALALASRIDRVRSGWRALTIEDVARELSPDYDKLIRQADRLRGTIHKAERVRSSLDANIAVADNRIEYRKREIGSIRRTLHRTGLHTDLETKALERWRRGNERGKDQKWAIRLKTARDRLAAVAQQASALLEEIRPEAERELHRRQKIAAEAQAQLDNLTRFAPDLRAARRLTRGL